MIKPSKCAHCHDKSHSTEECWFFFNSTTTHIKSERLRWLVTRVKTTTNTLNWKPPTSASNDGEHLLSVTLPDLLRKAESTRKRLLQNCPYELTGMCDSEFTTLPARVHVWLTIGLPRALAQQMLTGFVPRWVHEKPKKILVQQAHHKSADVTSTLQQQDLVHESHGRITRIPSARASLFVHSTCSRFPL